MNDIYDIKNTLLWFPINIENSLIFIIFIILLYFIIKYLLKKEEILEKIEEKIEIVKERKNYLEILNEFEINYLLSKNEIFYSKLAEIIREILEEKENKNISKMTFEEINKLKIDKSLKSLIKEVYFKEYVEHIENDSEDYRIDLIQKVKEII